MATDSGSAQLPNGAHHVPDVAAQQTSSDIEPSTPIDGLPPPSSQMTIPSTEPPGSPLDANASFRTEPNDDRGDDTIIPSSLTPPPSSQVPASGASNAHIGGGGSLYAAQPTTLMSTAAAARSSLFSPPPTTGGPAARGARGEDTPSSQGLTAGTGVSDEYVVPTPLEVREASADTLRGMMQGAIGEVLRLKSETAHHRLQLRLSAMQQDEDARRNAIEQDMAHREVEALREAEHARRARHELSAAAESSRTALLDVRQRLEDALDENEALASKLRVAKKVIRDQGAEISNLKEDRQQLRTRLRENRERFNMLRSPGGILHGILSPKQGASSSLGNAGGSGGLSTPLQQSRGTPRQTPRSGRRESKGDRDHSEQKFEALLQVLSQENNSAPSTPTTSKRPPPRVQSKHTRNVQSLSSLPTTPIARTSGRSSDGHLLPSAQLIPQTEPAPRFTNRRYLPDARPPRAEETTGRRSRESTISVPDADPNAELARKALASVESLNSVQKASTTLSMAASSTATVEASSRGHVPHSHQRHALPRRIGEEDEEEEDDDDIIPLPPSQASAAASEMLRRDPRESFDVASSADSRDGTPAPDARTQALLSNIARHKQHPMPAGGGDSRKRTFSAANADGDASLTANPPSSARRELVSSPPKKARIGVGPAPQGPKPGKVGLGINY